MRLAMFVAFLLSTSASSVFAEESNRPADFGSGYESWGTRGGATLGKGIGVRAELIGGGGTWYGGYGWGTLEGQVLFSLSKDFDLGVGARLPFWPFGISPGVQFRYRIIGGQKFQLAFDGSVYLPMHFAGYYYGWTPVAGPTPFYFGISIEPGVMMSFFIKDNMELFFGGLLPFFLRFTAGTGAGLGFIGRVGFAYTLKKHKVGFFAYVQVGPQFSFTGYGPFFAGFWGAFHVGAQFRF